MSSQSFQIVPDDNGVILLRKDFLNQRSARVSLWVRLINWVGASLDFLSAWVFLDEIWETCLGIFFSLNFCMQFCVRKFLSVSLWLLILLLGFYSRDMELSENVQRMVDLFLGGPAA